MLLGAKKKYPGHAGRGITICARWDDYSMFLLDMGEKPSSQYSLDRIDNDGNYEPANCRWATKTQQNRNTRRNKLTMAKAESIRRMRHVERRLYKEIGETFGIAAEHARAVALGRVWKDSDAKPAVTP